MDEGHLLRFEKDSPRKNTRAANVPVALQSVLIY